MRRPGATLPALDQRNCEGHFDPLPKALITLLSKRQAPRRFP